jgi:glucose 1-dehydrogenase
MEGVYVVEIKLEHKNALVTGANSGIGKAVALALAAAGADVVVNYVVNPDAADDVAKQIESSGRKALKLEADISDQAAVDNMFHEVNKAWGGVDILVNNAGIDGKRALGWEADPQAWRRVLEVNLLGSFYCARAALKGMVSRKKGVVLNIASVHEVIPWEGYSAYTASKAGMGMLTKTLAMEAAPFGIRVLSLAPGAIETPINQDVWSDPEKRKDLLSKIPIGRMGSVEEIGQMAAVLVSDAASYVTGTTVFVDGGMTLYPSFEHGG